MRSLSLTITTLLILFSCSTPRNETLETILQKDDLVAFQKIRKEIRIDTVSFFHGRNILHSSIESYSEKISKQLIDESYRLNAIDSSGQTPLLLAIISDNTKSTRLLLEKPIDLNIVDNLNGFSALHYAIVKSDLELFKKLIEKGANYNIQSNRMDQTPLHLAIEQNNSDMVRLLLQKKALDTIQDINGDTVSDIAITSTSLEIKSLFIDKFSIEDKKSLLLHEVKSGFNKEFVSKLTQEAWVSKKVINDAFIFSKDSVIANTLLQKGASVRYISPEYKYGAIHYAAIKGDVTLLDFLIQKGADINQISKQSGMSTLMYAASLYDNFNSLNKDFNGIQISMNEIFYDQLGMSKEKTKENSLEAVKFLIDKKANLNFENKNQENALYYAESTHNNSVASYLREMGCIETKKYKESKSEAYNRTLNN